METTDEKVIEQLKEKLIDIYKLVQDSGCHESKYLSMCINDGHISCNNMYWEPEEHGEVTDRNHPICFNINMEPAEWEEGDDE